MSIIIPEIQFYKLIKGILQLLRQDLLDNPTTPEKTLLYKYYQGLQTEKYNYFDQAKDLFIRDKDHPRMVDVHLGFNTQRSQIPSLHITMPGDSEGANSLGIGQYDEEDSVIDQDGVRIVMYERRFNSQYHLVCTSDNSAETTLLYHTIRAGIITTFDSLSLLGLENAKLSGQELKINPELVPNHIFMKAIGVSFEYEVKVPQWWGASQILDICVQQATPLITNNIKFNING